MSQINNYKLSVTSRLRNRVFTNFYEIAVSNMDQAKKKADEYIKDIQAPRRVESAELSRYYKNKDQWKVCMVYNTGNPSNITAHTPVQSVKHSFLINKNLITRLRNISHRKNVHINDIIRSLIENYVEIEDFMKQEEKK